MAISALKPGDVCFVMHNDSWLSRAIAWFMGSQWSHSFIVLEVAADRTYIMETSDYTVTFGHLERYLQDPNVTLEAYTSDMTVEQGTAMMLTVIMVICKWPALLSFCCLAELASI